MNMMLLMTLSVKEMVHLELKREDLGLTLTMAASLFTVGTDSEVC